MGFKIGDNVSVNDDAEPAWVGRVVGYLGEAYFEVEGEFDQGAPRKVHAQQMRHLDSVKLRVAAIKR